MSRFYIEKLLIQGANVPDAELKLKDGVNFIIGPSNTGKSLVMDAIDYVFGLVPDKKHPFRFDPSFGYTEFTIVIKTERGTVTLKRSTQKPKTKVYVTSSDPDIRSGFYYVSGGDPTLNELYLKLMGIKESHEVWSSADGRKNRFTWRNILHMFFIKQAAVSRESSVFLNPEARQGTNDTSVLYSLLFMLRAEDAEAGDNPDTAATKKAKREAVVTYIKDNIERIQKRLEEIRDSIATGYAPDIGGAANAITSQLDEIEEQLTLATKRSEALVQELYSDNSKLSEYIVMQDRFAELRGQYLSDIERLTFVVDGETIRAKQPVHKKCPFCDGEIIIDHKPKYVDAVRSDLVHIQSHLSSLEIATDDVQRKIEALKAHRQALEQEKAAIDKSINTDLRPRFLALKARLADYREYIRLTREIEILEDDEKRYNGELLARETAKDTATKEHIFKQDIDFNDIHGFENVLIRILQSCGFSGYSAARWNMDTVDLEIAGHQKSLTNGGGYCGILNTIMALSMMEYLLENGVYPPGLLYVDSSLSQLSESEQKERGETIKARFINYIITHPRNGQVIIIEHKEKVPVDMIINSGANIIEFTGVDDGKTRYGLLPDVTNDVH